ncbi:ABC transporter ATP-binding protein [Ruficoccus amylovorans]|uniref:ABC transporter ATP-binding protein n=1 Tax=Ruficoccus amylovorans TaxID=1804625 RepID=A0A842HKR7_9BACT|nr:ABC transporter ATP-binding protein [Ruficoccus amylovorans]MBC2596067.1 ABC transporter ATP-binding protein [Ruficoccus amylovorans]
MTEPILSYCGVTKRYERGKPVLESLDLDVQEGDFVSIIGPSGCGKSTLLRLTAGLSPLSEGQIVFRDGEPARRNLGFIFQDATLLPWLDVRRNVEMPLKLASRPRAEREGAAREVLGLVGLRAVSDRFPRQLSGGMKMRVSLARGLVQKPSLLLLDEPFGALDAITRNQLNAELLALRGQSPFTALFVTHSVNEAVFLSNRIVVLSANPGRIAHTVEVPFAYPRAASLREDPAFHRLCAELMHALAEAAPAR